MTSFPLLLAQTTSFWQLVVDSIRASSAIEVGILLLLLICSFASWAIVLWKLKAIRSARAGNAAMSEGLAGGKLDAAAEQAGAGPNVEIYRAAQGLLTTRRGDGTRSRDSRVQLAMDHTNRRVFTQMHRGMDILASIASATPFIGLFGTVLGIMHTFQVLGKAKSASLNVVAPGIAAALIATAAGLAVAIPAVFLYNWLSARMDEIQEQSDMFIESLSESLVDAGHLQQRTIHETHAAAEPMIVGQGAQN